MVAGSEKSGCSNLGIFRVPSYSFKMVDGMEKSGCSNLSIFRVSSYSFKMADGIWMNELHQLGEIWENGSRVLRK